MRVIQPENGEGPSPPSSTSFSLSHRTPSSQLSSSPPPFYRPETRSPKAAWDQAKGQAPQHRLSDPARPFGGQGLHLSGNLSHGHLVSSYPLLFSVPKSSPGPCLSSRTVPKATVWVLSRPRRLKVLNSARNTSSHKPRHSLLSPEPRPGFRSLLNTAHEAGLISHLRMCFETTEA